MHESLRCAVLHEFPVLTDAMPPRQQGWTGFSGIQGVMLGTCVDYLMLGDFIWSEMIASPYIPRYVHDSELGRKGCSCWYREPQLRSQVHEKMWNDHRTMWQDHLGVRGRVFSSTPCPAYSYYRKLTGPPLSCNTDPFGAFFHYAAWCWTDHLGSAPVDFNLDDVLELANPVTSARHKAWMLESHVWYPDCSLRNKHGALCLIAGFGNVSMLEQVLAGRFPLNENIDEDRRLIVAAATTAIRDRNLGNFRALMNHLRTSEAMQTDTDCTVLSSFARCWRALTFEGDDLTEWTRLIRGLFDELASIHAIPSPSDLLGMACSGGCLPLVEMLLERAEAYSDFQNQLLMQPTTEFDPFRVVAVGAASSGNYAPLRYLCQQDDIKASAKLLCATTRRPSASRMASRLIPPGTSWTTTSAPK